MTGQERFKQAFGITNVSLGGFDYWKDFWIPRNFPVDYHDVYIHDFQTSLWQHWVDSIDKIKSITYSGIPDIDPETGDILSYECPDEEYIKDDALNNLQGAMFVSIWSCMEKFLKGILPYLCVLNTPNSKLSDAYKLCKDQITNPILFPKWICWLKLNKLNCVKKRYEKNRGRSTFQFPMFRDAYKKIDSNGVGSIKQFNHINDIRLLNNIFKHLSGVYNYQNKECKQLSQSIQKKLQIDSECRSCNLGYQKLNSQEYIKYCNLFANDVFDKVKKQLKAQGYIS